MKFDMAGGGGLVKPLKKKQVKKTASNGATLAEKKQPAVDVGNVEKSIPSTEVLKPDKNVEFEDEQTLATSKERLDAALAQSSLTATGQNFSKSDPIVLTRYCYGCLRSSISKLGTTEEKFFCQRDPDDKGVVDFVLVKPTYTIGQCCYRLDEEIPF